jgi:hypothetical protein
MPTAISKIRWCSQFLAERPQERFTTYQLTHDLDNMTVKEFFDHLLNALEAPEDRLFNVREQYDQARQKEGQSSSQFHDYLAGLEAQMEPLSDTTLAQNYLMRLRPEIKRQLNLLGYMDRCRDAIVQAALRIENALKRNDKESRVTANRRHEGSERRKQQNRHRPYPQRGSGGNTTQATSNQNASTSNTTRLGTCHHCGKIGHYARDCRSRISNPNQQPVNTQVNRNHTTGSGNGNGQQSGKASAS